MAYEIRISDWRSDVCSSDLLVAYGCGLVILILFCMERFNQPTAADGTFIETFVLRAVSNGYRSIQSFVIYVAIMVVVRSEAGSVGKGCVMTCRFRGSAYH